MDYKRNISEVSNTDTHDEKKAHTKSGRKPIETEPKSRRTAQNRAAQRAYRERKEKKMKDLEDKVKALEELNVKISTESDFLLAQVELLKGELSRYRGGSDFSDLSLPTTVGALTKKDDKEKDVTSTNLANMNNFLSYKTSSQSSSPWNRNWSGSEPLDNSSSSNFTSPLNNNPMVSPDSSVGSSSVKNTSLDVTQRPFDEQADAFCASLNQACGTKACPIPKYETRDGTEESNGFNGYGPAEVPNGVPAEVPIDNTLAFNPSLEHTFSDLENLKNLNTKALDLGGIDGTFYNFSEPFLDNFDVDLAFGLNEFQDSNADRLASLTTEESVYDPYVTENTAKVQMKEETDDEVVPAQQDHIKCSEIWDRITAHPRYTDIDIDGLCQELKAKAKCSEKGVVINSVDVNLMLEKSAKRE